MYGMIQALAAVRAMDRITEPVLTRFEELHEQMCASTDPELMHDLNYEFHMLINKTGGSKRVRAMLRHLSSNLARELYRLPAAANTEANAGHARILKALRNGDIADLDAANQEHVRREGDYVVAALKQSGVLVDS